MKKTWMALFDFDGTLFNSPDEPHGYRGEKWSRNLWSLQGAVPESPQGPGWWNLPVLQSALRCCKDPSCWAAMATGRNNDIFRPRVEQLPGQQGLDFDSVSLNPDRDTLEYKSDLLRTLVRRNAPLGWVEVWDNREDHLVSFRELLLEVGVPTVICHHVQAPRIPPFSSDRDIAQRVVSHLLGGQ